MTNANRPGQQPAGEAVRRYAVRFTHLKQPDFEELDWVRCLARLQMIDEASEFSLRDLQRAQQNDRNYFTTNDARKNAARYLGNLSSLPKWMFEHSERAGVAAVVCTHTVKDQRGKAALVSRWTRERYSLQRQTIMTS